MRVPSWSVLALLLTGVCVAGDLAYASFPGAEEAKDNSASSSRGVQAIGAARGYAHVNLRGALTAKSSGVVGVRPAVDTNSRRIIVFGAYCFNLTFRPVVVIGSPVPAGTDAGSIALSISTAPNPRGTLSLDIGRPIECPAGFRDAAVVVRSSGNRLSMSTAGLFVLFF